MRRALFGESGYGLDALGSEQSVQKLQIADVRSFHRDHTAPNNCVLAIYGDVNAKAVNAAVAKAFKNWQPGPSKSPRSPLPAPILKPRSGRIAEIRDKKQAVVVLGFPGVTVFDKERYALDLIQEACSDLGSRLFLRIRESLGLAYYVGAQHLAGLAPGYFAFYCGTAPDKVERVEQELAQEAELLRSEGLTPEELKRAQAKIIGQKKIERQDLGHLATLTSFDELCGLGYAHIDAENEIFQALDLDQVRAAAMKYLKPETRVVSVVKPEKP
jgi:zinc protease